MSMAIVEMKRMMMTMIRKALFFIILMSSGIIGYAQNNDFGIWYGIAAERKLVKNLELDLSACVRTFENASKIEEAFLEAGLTYKFNDFISAEGSYRITENIEDDDSFHLRHKWFLGVKGSLSPGDFTFSGRVRFQKRYKTFFEDEEDKIPDSHIRCRLKTLYDIPSFPVNPFLSAEIFLPVFTEAGRTIDKNRFMFGAEYNITKKQSVELEYIFQRDYLPKLSDINIISVQYNFKF